MRRLVSTLRSVSGPSRRVWPALALGLSVLATPAPLLAHAELVTSSPLPNSSLVDAPDQVSIVFSEPIDPGNGSIELLDAQLRSVEGVGPLRVADENAVASVDLPALEAGIYTVSYQVFSTVDGHATQGQFAFVVDPTGAEAPPTSPPASSSPSVDGWAVAARWLALVSALVGFGSLAIWWQAARPALRSLAPASDRRAPWRVVGASSAGVVIGLLLYVSLAARPAAGGAFDITAALGSTAYAVAMRVAITAALVAMLVAGLAALRGDRAERAVAAAVAAFLGVTLAGTSAAGHASSLGGVVNAGIDWLHLVAAAAWLGGLPVVYAMAGRAVANGTSRRTVVTEILRRHGRVALVAGPVVVLTGLANSPVVLGDSRELVASGYGNLLLVKATLVSVALGIGAANHLLVRSKGRGAMATLVASELLIAALAVMAAAAMVTIQPAAARQPVVVGPSVQPAHFFAEAGRSDIHASVSVPAPGNQSYQVTVRDGEDGRPPTDLQAVFLTLTPPPGSGLATERVELDAGELDGLYATTGAHTPIAGDWGLDVIVRRSEAPEATVSFGMLVEEPNEPIVARPADTGVGVPAPLALLWGVLPSGLAGWIPALAAIAIAVMIGFARWRPPAVRMGLLATAVILVLAAGSRSLVEAANTPTTDDLAAFESTATGSVDNGERIYLANCASCHGTDGDGEGPVRLAPAPAPLAEILPAMSDAEVSYRIANGLAGTRMPAFAASLTEAERRDLVSYLHKAWGAP